MGLPQIILIIVLAVSVGISIEMHGRPKQGNHNVFIDLTGAGIIVALLWWGGFWS